jgi:hypothetical protein
MNHRQAIIWIVLAILVMGASLWYLASGTANMNGGVTASTTSWAATSTTVTYSGALVPPTIKTPVTQNPGTGVVVRSPKLAGVGSLTSLLALKSNLTCTISTTGTVEQKSGTLYLSGFEALAVLTSTVSGQTEQVNMIDDNQYLYVWAAGSTSGTKARAAVGVNGSAIAMRGGLDPAQNLSYQCNDWTPDTNLLGLPANVTFTDTNGN